ncbi:MAG: hypothetical protein J6O40_01755 [Ruminococcus sp.]|nr:hypothetical protein [Ruminococcus sp.]
MKTRKLNRGLALGAVLLVGLAGFVTFDHFNFKGNKADIESAVKTYIEDSAKASISADGDCTEAWKKVIEDNWGYNKFYSENFLFNYTTAQIIQNDIDNLKNDFDMGHLTDCSVKFGEIKVSKSGPNLAQASVEYTISFKGRGEAYLLTMNGLTNAVTDSSNYDFGEEGDKEEGMFSDLEYEGRIEYDDSSVFYLEFESGEWKIVGAEYGRGTEFTITNENGDALDLAKIAKGESGAVKGGDGDKAKAEGAIKIKLPDGTVMDVPEGEELPDLSELPKGAEIIKDNDTSKPDADKSEQAPEAGTQEDSSSAPEPEVEDLDKVEPNPSSSESESSSSEADEPKGENVEKTVADDGTTHYYDKETGEELLAANKLRGWR